MNDRFVSSTLLIALSLVLLWHFFNIWRYGSFYIAEPNVVVKIAETAGLLLILLYGVYAFARGLKA